MSDLSCGVTFCSRTIRASVLAAALGCLCAPSSVLAQAPLHADVYVSGLSAPIAFVQDPSDSTVQYVVQQGGRIRVVKNGALQPTDFLDISGQISCCGEQGLLGLAFPSDYATSMRFYVNFTNPAGHTVVARFKRSATPLIADTSTRFDFLWPGGNLFIAQPYSNHNGGTLAFGPDGYLYVGMGDGGAGGDPQHRAQNPNTLLGKMLRLNVGVPEADPEGYDVPPDNPFLDGIPVNALGEIWAFGLRNPWKFGFDDPAHGGTGALVIGDVGQGGWEEVDYQPPGIGGVNWGWRNREGAHPYDGSLSAAYQPLVDPIWEYDHTVGYAVIGGYVYRGPALGPSFFGRYFFGDLLGRVWSLALAINPVTGEATASNLIEHTSALGGTSFIGQISSFGVDASGELYVVSLGQNRILRISPTCPYSIDPTSVSYSPAAGGGTVAVSAPTGCSWTAVSNNGFVSVTGGAAGSGNGTVTYTVAANTGAPNAVTAARSGTITIAGRLFTVNQTGCTFAIAPTAETFGSGAGAGRVDIATPGACGWTVTGLPAWATTTSGASGTGPGAWQYSVAANGTGITRAQTVAVAGRNFSLTQFGVPLKPLVPGVSTSLTLTSAADTQLTSFEMVGGRSYCVQLASAPTPVTQATPTLSVFRADGTTPLGTARPTGTCLVAPATESSVVGVTQSDASARSYRLRIAETTLWANWFFIGGSYSSYTLLRNTTNGSLNATITWRSETGVVVGSETVAVPANRVIYRDARVTTSGAITGSVEIGHDAEPQALVSSQTTLSATTGLSFDTLALQRINR